MTHPRHNFSVLYAINLGLVSIRFYFSTCFINNERRYFLSIMYNKTTCFIIYMTMLHFANLIYLINRAGYGPGGMYY